MGGCDIVNASSFGINPFPVSFQKGYKPFEGEFRGDVFFNRCFPTVDADVPGCCPYIAIIGVGHLSGAVDYTPHDCDFKTLEMRGGLFDDFDG